MRYLLGILFLFLSITSFAQTGERPLVQFSGVTRTADTLRGIVPYVNITNVTTKKQLYVSNYAGYFSFVARELDTLRFTSVGYNSITIVIPAKVANKSLILDVLLKPLIVNLPMVRIFPWATTDEFRKDFLAMKIADDDLEIARKNLSLSNIHAWEAATPASGYVSLQDFHNNLVNSHSITNPLLNPFAWGSLIKDIAAGDKAN